MDEGSNYNSRSVFNRGFLEKFRPQGLIELNRNSRVLRLLISKRKCLIFIFALSLKYVGTQSYNVLTYIVFLSSKSLAEDDSSFLNILRPSQGRQNKVRGGGGERERWQSLFQQVTFYHYLHNLPPLP